MSDPVLDVRSARALLRRRSRLLAAAAVLGLAAGAAYVALVPPTLTSTTLVLLPTPTVSVGERDVDTQVRIVLSSAVLAAAGRSQSPPLAERTVRGRVGAEALTTQLIEIRARSTVATRAEALSQAVAESYVVFVREADRRVTAAALSDLNGRADGLQQQVEVLQGEIDATAERSRSLAPGSSDARREAQLLARLRAEQADLSLQLDKVKGDITTATPVGATGGIGTAVLQDASPAEGAHLVRRLITWPPAGAVSATLTVAGLILLTSRRDPRMGLRDEIADAVGSPVLAGLRSHPERSVAGWRVVLRSYDASSVEAWALRQVLRGLAVADRQERRTEPRSKIEHPRSVLVVSLDGDGRGLAIGPQLAAFAASLGIVTRLVAGAGEGRAAALWAALVSDVPTHPRPGLVIGPDPEDEKVDLTVVLVTLDRRAPSLGDAPSTTTTLLSVGAATATEQELARVAIAVDDANRRIDGIVVADPDRADRTSGRHLRDERVGRAALPVRLTGLTAVDSGADDSARRPS